VGLEGVVAFRNAFDGFARSCGFNFQLLKKALRQFHMKSSSESY